MIRALTLIFLFTDSLCFRCYQCFSHLSWEDCNKHAIKTDECKPPNVCFMAHRIIQRKGQQRHNFIKACYSPRWCPQERCRQTTQTSVDGSWCETKCCKEKDLCNTGMTPSWERAYVGKESAVNQNVPHKVCLLITVLLAMLTAWLGFFTLFSLICNNERSWTIA